MKRFVLVFALGAAAVGCGQWKGDGNDQAIPDVAGQVTGVNRSFGVLSQTLPDHADEDMTKNRPVAYENPFEEGEKPAASHAAPKARHE